MKTKNGTFPPDNTAAPASVAGSGISPDEALKKLLDGNRSFVENRLTIMESCGPATRRAIASEQHPYAIILSCSDSRVPPEIIFNKGLGELFVVRDAGNIVAPIVLGTIEFAVQYFGATLIMVLGHSKCGAVTTAVDGNGYEGSNIGAVIEKIAPAVGLAGKQVEGSDKSRLVEATIDFNIRLSAQSLLSESQLIHSLVDSGKVRIVCAKYDVEEGTVKLLSTEVNQYKVAFDMDLEPNLV